MVYDLMYKDRAVFDIEIWLDNVKKDLWRSEIKSSFCVYGGTNFVFEQIKTQEQLNEFQDDCQRLIDLRFWLYEFNDNSSADMNTAHRRHYDKVMPHIKEEIERFSNKYKLTISED